MLLLFLPLRGDMPPLRQAIFDIILISSGLVHFFLPNFPCMAAWHGMVWGRRAGMHWGGGEKEREGPGCQATPLHHFCLLSQASEAGRPSQACRLPASGGPSLHTTTCTLPSLSHRHVYMLEGRLGRLPAWPRKKEVICALRALAS